MGNEHKTVREIAIDAETSVAAAHDRLLVIEHWITTHARHVADRTSAVDERLFALESIVSPDPPKRLASRLGEAKDEPTDRTGP